MEDEFDGLEKGPWFTPDMNTGQRMVVRNLVLAAKNGDEEVVMEILKKGEVDINSKYKWETALMVAGRKNNTRLCTMLLEHGADCNISRLYQQTSLWIAAFHGNLEAMELMLATNQCTQQNMNNTFLRCVSMNFLDGCEMLLNAGASVNAADSMGFKAIHRAAGTNETAAALKDMWKTINTETWRMYHSTNLELCELLLSWKADVNSLDSVQSTPLHHAAESGKEDVCRLLIEEGADVNAIGGIFRKTPLHIAVSNEYPQLVDIFLTEPDIAPNLIDADNDTPLMTAIKLHKKECVRVFLKQESWPDFMSVSVLPKGEDKMIDTPLRLMIRHMPDVATQVMNNCIELSSYKDAKNPDFTARFNFAFLDDSYTSKYWSVDNGNIAATSFIAPETNGYENTAETLPRTNNARGRCERRKKSKDELDGLPIPAGSCVVDGRSPPRSGIGGLKKRRPTIVDPWTGPSISSRHVKDKALPCDSRCFTCLTGMSSCKLNKKVKPYTPNAAVLKKNHPLMIAYQEKCTQILSHPLSIALINHKWRKLGRFSFYGRLIMKLIFVGLLTAQILYNKVQVRPSSAGQSHVTTTVSNLDSNGSSPSSGAVLVSTILLIVACLHLAAEVFLMCTQVNSYFSILENYNQLFIYSSSIYLVLVEVIFESAEKHTERTLEAITVFLAWFNIALTLRKFPVIGIFFIMFTRILKNSITVLLIFFPIIMGFAFTFTILLDSLSLFSKEFSIATVLVMLSGEVEYADTMTKMEINKDAASIVAYVFFIVVMVICLLNLLVGLAVSDVESLHKESEGEMMTLKAEEVASCEFYMSKYFRRKIACGCLKYQPNKKTTCFPNSRGRSRLSIRKKIASWFNFLDFNDYRLSAANLLRIMRKEPKQDYGLLRREIAQLRNQLDVSAIPLSPRLSCCESRFSRKLSCKQQLRPPLMKIT